MIKQRFKSWSQSRLGDYDQCPRMAKHKHLDKLCPRCFKGRVMGGYETPAICDTCGEEIIKGDALVRGTEIGVSLEKYVNGTGKVIDPRVRHPKALALAKALRADFKKGKVKVEFMLNFDRNWKLLPPGWSPSVWLIVKLDVFRMITKTSAKVTDWKTGGIDKRTGKVRDDDKYGEQLQIYSTAMLTADPKLESMTSDLVFTDCGPRFDPVIEKADGCIAREDLAANQKALTKRALPLLSDEVFAPKPNPRCTYCDFSKGKGGPCPY